LAILSGVIVLSTRHCGDHPHWTVQAHGTQTRGSPSAGKRTEHLLANPTDAVLDQCGDSYRESRVSRLTKLPSTSGGGGGTVHGRQGFHGRGRPIGHERFAACIVARCLK
jgi:hypothetical protein